MATTTMSIRLPEELTRELDTLAKAINRSRSYCAIEAIKKFVATESWQIQAIEAGLEDADHDRLIDHKTVRQWVESWDNADEKAMPECK